MAEIKRLQLGVANRFTVGLFVGLEHRQNRKKLFKAANNFLKSDLQTNFFPIYRTGAPTKQALDRKTQIKQRTCGAWRGTAQNPTK
jgi:hypothetical protein